ncbi:ATP-dependent Clp protease ATP-binding subunit ClpX, partial [bacterium]|nr:ATP-dependent Clp protease ATP-binding subunit ClpX [bacterium]
GNKKRLRETDELLSQVDQEDLIAYGMIPEFIGRLPVITPLNDLKREDLIRILTEPKNAIIRQYQSIFAMSGKTLTFEREALEWIADKAIEKKTGARGLRAIIEKCMTNLIYTLPEAGEKKEFVVRVEDLKKETDI